MKTLPFVSILFTVLLCSCGINKHLPTPADLPLSTLGADASIYSTGLYERTGELIAVDTEKLYFLAKTNLSDSILVIYKSEINSMTLSYSRTSNSPDKFGVWTALCCLSTASHGYFLIFTLPINFIAGLAVATHAANDTYSVSYPETIKWEEVKKFARFPQGIPPGISLSMIHSP